MITHTISVIELVWTIFCSIGLLFSIQLLRRAVEDLLLLRREEINNFREFSAVTSVWIFGILVYIQASYVLVGIMAMSVPSPNGHIYPTSYIIGAVFVSSSLIFDVVAYIISKRKDQLVDMIKGEIAAGRIQAYGHR